MHWHLLRCAYTNCILEYNVISWVYEECLDDCYRQSSLYFSMGRWLLKGCQRAWPTTLFCTNFCTNTGNVCDSSTQWYTVLIALLQNTFLVNLGNHRANIMNFLCKCELQMILGLLIFLSMKHCLPLVNLSDKQLSFLILVIWLIAAPNTSNNFSPRLVIMKSIFYMQVVTDKQGARCWEIFKKGKSIFFVLRKQWERYDKISS